MSGILKNIDDFKKKYRAMTPRQKAKLYVQGGFMAVIFLIGLGLSCQVKAPVQTHSATTKAKLVSGKKNSLHNSESEALLIGDDIEQKSYVARIENQYYSVSEKNQNMDQKISDLAQQVDQLTKAQVDIASNVARFDNKLNDAVTKIVKGQQQQAPGGVGISNYSLDVTETAEVNTEDKKAVYLPAGSFLSGELF